MRGGIVDVFPSTADSPVRIDLWGDEVDRLTAFAISDQRSSRDLARALFFGCREPCSPTRCGGGRAPGRAPALGCHGLGPPGRGRAVRRHGVVAALRRHRGAGAARPARGRRRRSSWSSPAGSATAPSSSSTRRPRWPRPWPSPGARETRRGALPAPARPLRPALERERGRRVALPTVPEGPSTAALAVGRFDPVAGDPARLAGRRDPPGRRGLLRHPVRGDRAGAGRLSAALAEEGVHAPVLDAAAGRPGAWWWSLRWRAGSSCPRPRWQSCPRPTSPAAGSRTGGPGPGPGPPTASSTTSRRAASWSTASTAWPASRG